MAKEERKTSGAGDLCFVSEKGRSEMCVMKRKEKGGGVYRGGREEREGAGCSKA